MIGKTPCTQADVRRTADGPVLAGGIRGHERLIRAGAPGSSCPRVPAAERASATASTSARSRSSSRRCPCENAITWANHAALVQVLAIKESLLLEGRVQRFCSPSGEPNSEGEDRLGCESIQGTADNSTRACWWAVRMMAWRGTEPGQR